MGLIGTLLGLVAPSGRGVGRSLGAIGKAVVARRAAREAGVQARAMGALQQYSAEFEHAHGGWFDSLVNGLNRLPRPFLAFGTMGLFVYAMVDPQGFSARMEGLRLVPEPLWWLFGAVVSFYFGARELHHLRVKSRGSKGEGRRDKPASSRRDNAALDAWRDSGEW